MACAPGYGGSDSLKLFLHMFFLLFCFFVSVCWYRLRVEEEGGTGGRGGGGDVGDGAEKRLLC